MTIDEVNILNNKALKRKDGVYSFRGNVWAVKNNKFIAFANQFGEVYLNLGSFNTQIGKVDILYRKEKLKEWLYSQ